MLPLPVPIAAPLCSAGAELILSHVQGVLRLPGLCVPPGESWPHSMRQRGGQGDALMP